MGATLSHFAFLVEGRLGEKGFYRHVEVAAWSVEQAKDLAVREIAGDGGDISGFDEVEDRGPARSAVPGMIAAHGYVLFPLGES